MHYTTEDVQLGYRSSGLTSEDCKRNMQQNAKACEMIGKEKLDLFLAHGGWAYQLKSMLGTGYAISVTPDTFNVIVSNHGASLREIGYECVYDTYEKWFRVRRCK